MGCVCFGGGVIFSKCKSAAAGRRATAATGSCQKPHNTQTHAHGKYTNNHSALTDIQLNMPGIAKLQAMPVKKLHASTA